jgi:UDP-glucose 6-dehydrogenase
MNVTVFGSGYVGVVAAGGLSDPGNNNVPGLDLNTRKIAVLNREGADLRTSLDALIDRKVEATLR